MIALVLAWLAPVMKVFAVGKVALMGVLAAVGALLIQRKLADVAEKKEANLLAEKVVENHAVAQKESAAETDEEADAALDAAAHSEHS